MPARETAAHINNFELGQHGRHRTNVWDYAGVKKASGGFHVALAHRESDGIDIAMFFQTRAHL